MNYNLTAPPLKKRHLHVFGGEKVGGSNNSQNGHEKLGDVRLSNAPFSNAVTAVVYFIIII